MKRTTNISLILALAGLTQACNDEATNPETIGVLSAAITAGGPSHDVTAVHFKVVSATDSCDAPAIAETTSALEAEALPGSVLPAGAGTPAGADGLFVLPPGDYRVCATPMAGETPSAECAPTEGTASVIESTTTEILLVSQCDGEGNGGLDAIVALNDPPTIDDLDIAASKFITECESATITVFATDPNGDAVGYSWAVLASPAGSSPSLVDGGATATFSTDLAGDYQLQVTASDVYGASTSLTFPIHVSEDDCADSSFFHAFAAGPTTQVACDAWEAFRGQISSGGFASVVVRGSNDSTGRSCTDPSLATQICNALGSGTPFSVDCDGNTWSTGVCGAMTTLGDWDAWELTVGPAGICQCAGGDVYTVRPCIDVPFSNPNWGGITTGTCSAPSQTLEVVCE